MRIGSHFPGGNTWGTESPTKRRTHGPGQSGPVSARYECGRTSRPNEIIRRFPLVSQPVARWNCPSNAPWGGIGHRFTIRILSLTWVELRGLEPLASCMPSTGSTSTRVYRRRSPSQSVRTSPPDPHQLLYFPAVSASLPGQAPNERLTSQNFQELYLGVP